MKLKKVLLCVGVSLTLFLSGCGSSGSNEKDTGENTSESSEVKTALDKIDMTQWQYNKDNDVYWQTGIVYCENPADETYENLGIYVPGAYMSGKENGDGTYTCKVDTSGSMGGYTAKTAPIVREYPVR